ncbi:MAG: C40 family peptidase [Bacteroidales bacterium]
MRLQVHRICIGLFTISTLLLLAPSCSLTKKTSSATSDRVFYKKKGEQLGIKFKGGEDKALITAAIPWLGVPYKYGGNSKSGIDCSALAYNIYYEAHRIKLSRPVSAMVKQVKSIKKNNIQSGDLVFFSINEKKASHVGIYLGEDKFIHASTSQGVSVASLHNVYWKKHLSGIGRILPASKSAPKAEKVEKAPAPAAKKQPAKTERDDNAPPLIVFDNEF